MNTTLRLAALAFTLALAGTAHAADSHTPRHGGVVTETRAFDVELVVKPELVQIYLRDHAGKPLKVDQASAKLTLLSDKEQQEAELKPVGDRLEATGSFKAGAGTKAVARIVVPDKMVTARFTLK